MNFIYRFIMKIGRISSFCRKKYYYSKIQGGGYRLADDVHMYYPENITIGKGTYINGGYIFASPNGRITIGENCLISYNVHIRTSTHNYEQRDSLILSQGQIEHDIVIGNDVWIGFGAQILSGVTIADGSVIGAGAIVSKSTEPYGVYVGVPARLIKNRK